MPYKVFGCKVNKYYLNLRLDFFYKNGNDLHDTMLIDTCVVTDRAKNKWVKEVKSAISQGFKVMITGCGSFDRGNLISSSKFYKIYPELKEKSDLIQLLPESPQEFLVLNDPQTKGYSDRKWGNLISVNSSVYTKHFLVIQNGCDNHCSFCLTVSKRGPHTSRPLDEIIQEIHQVELSGGKEIVITGINLAARGCSNSAIPSETKFPYLLHEILKKTTIPRIRISSVGPEYANDEFFEIISDERILPHFHYSIQSFSNNVLKNMKRHYSSEELKLVLKKTRDLIRPDKNLISIGADIIVGFAGETESDFMETYNGIADFGVTKLHVFPFSDHTKRDGIPASNFPNQIENSVKKEREARLIVQGEKIRNEFIGKNMGTSHKVLLEEKRGGKRRGRTDNYIQIEVEGNYHRGDIIDYIIK